MTTQADLNQLVVVLNNRLGRPQYGWTYNPVNKQNVASVGALALDGAYGGWKLVEVLSASGALREVSPRLGKADLELYLRALLTGIEYAEVNLPGEALPSWGPYQAEDMGTSWSREQEPLPDTGAGASVEAYRG